MVCLRNKAHLHKWNLSSHRFLPILSWFCIFGHINLSTCIFLFCTYLSVGILSLGQSIWIPWALIALIAPFISLICYIFDFLNITCLNHVNSSLRAETVFVWNIFMVTYICVNVHWFIHSVHIYNNYWVPLYASTVLRTGYLVVNT